METTLKYGHEGRTLRLPDHVRAEVLAPAAVPVLPDPAAALAAALEDPLALPGFWRRPAPRSIAVAVPDETRPAPLRALLPVLLDRLAAAWPGLPVHDRLVLVGGGLHPPLDAAGINRVTPPEALRGWPVLAHDANSSPLADLGRTSRGTPVLVNEAFARAELKIVVGQVDPHQFVGFTGGAKGAVIGLGGAATIEANHGLMFHELARVGQLGGNPVREDLNEAGRMIGVDLVVNVVLDSDKRVAGLWAGEPLAVLERGAAACAGVYGVAIADKYDLALASCGGHPKDICLYQAQKGLNLASQAVKPGGRIILLAACPQGVGDDVYYEYVGRFGSCAEVMDDFRDLGFKMGAHKAYLFGRSLMNFQVVVDSSLPEATLSRCHIPGGDAQAAIDSWASSAPAGARVAIIPNANTTYFYVQTAGTQIPARNQGR